MPAGTSTKHTHSVLVYTDGTNESWLDACTAAWLPFVARAVLLACIGGLAFIVHVRLWWFPAVTIDRGAKQRIVGAGTATATEPTREHKQYAIQGGFLL